MQAVGGHHPLAHMTSSISGYNKTSLKSFQGIFTLNYKIPFIKGLEAKLMVGYYNSDQFQKVWKKKFDLYTYNNVTNTYNVASSVNSPSNMTGIYTPTNRTTVLGQLNYSRMLLEKHSIRAALIFEERHNINDNLQAKKEFSIDIDQFFAGISNPTVTSANITENDNQSVIGRINYDYLSKYLIELGFNYNGSSKFPRGERWGFFPYSSAGWRISEEGFIKNNLTFITDLKVRGSWGIMGDDAASTFQFLTGYNYPSGNYIIDNQIISGLGFRGIPNPNITWYTIETKNIGFDLNLGKGLINMQFDLFRRDRSGLLATRILVIPGTVGASLSQENLNKDMRKGFEVVIGTKKEASNFRYDISTSFSYSRGQNTYIERSADGNSYRNWRNNTTNRWDNIGWGYNYIGQFQTQDEINTSPIQDGQGNRTLRPGDYKYADTNRDGIIDAVDQIPMRRTNTPEMNLSLIGRFNYRQFDLSILFEGAANFDHAIEYVWACALPWDRNFLAIYEDSWHHEDIYDLNSPWIPGKYASPTTRMTIPSNHYTSRQNVLDSKYIRLKNMEIGYTLNQSLSTKLHLENLRIYVTGFNLLTYSKMKIFDPEISSSRTYPIMRDITFGLTITL